MTPESHPGPGALENAEAAWAVPVMRPRLPVLASLKPYFEEIDANRWYGNYGPLERRFEQRLAAALDVEAEELVCVAVNLVQEDQRQDLPDTRHAAQQVVALWVVHLGGAAQLQL